MRAVLESNLSPVVRRDVSLFAQSQIRRSKYLDKLNRGRDWQTSLEAGPPSSRCCAGCIRVYSAPQSVLSKFKMKEL